VPTRSLQAAASSSSAAPEPPAAPAPEAPFPASLGLSLIQFHRNVGPILKGSKAKYGKYANLHALLAAVTPHLCEQGLVLSQTIEDAAPAQVLVTTLSHVVSGEQLRSAVQIPTLDALLERAHAVRLQALRAWPLDFGRVPAPPSFAIASRNGSANGNGSAPAAEATAAAQSAVIAPPARSAGEVALPDQLETLKATLVALGGNANPLHSLGGLITYLRRYQLLAILSLAAEDDDDDGDGWGADGPARSNARGPQARGSHAPEAGPRGPRPQPSASRPAAAPAPRPRPPHPPAPAPAPAAASPATATPEPAAPEPAVQEPAAPEPAVRESAKPSASDPGVVQALGPELSQEEVKAVVHRMVALPQAVLPQVLNEFRATFGLPQDVRLSDYIRNQAHAAFLEERIAAHSSLAPSP
jgi:hypothetical protein